MRNQEFIKELELIATSVTGVKLINQHILDLAHDGSLIRELDKSSWKIIKLENAISDCRNGLTYKNNPELRGLPISRIETISDGRINFSKVGYSDLTEETHGNYLIQEGNILFSHINSIEQLGKVAIYETGMNPLLHGMNLLRITPNKFFIPKFLFYMLKSSQVRGQVIQRAKRSINQASINMKELRSIDLPMPSLDHQQKIVERLDVLLSICSELEQSINDRNMKEVAFRQSTFDSISNAQTPQELQSAWERIQANWQAIVGSPESVGDLRRLILTFATSGLLVNQSLSEKVPKFESVASTKVIPKNWIWCELEAIANYGGNGSVSPKSIPKDGWILDLEDIEKSTSRLLVRSFGVDRKTTSNKSSFNSGDVLYGKLRPYLDKVLVADMPGFCTTEIVPIRPNDGLDPNWLRICLKRPEFIKKVTELSYGTKMPRLGTSDAKTSVHPIPPLEEQRRIVERVEQLFQICDQLELDLILSRSLGDKFARSVVSESA